MGNHFNHNFVITMANKMTLQTVELPQKTVPGKLEVTGQGVGCALLQVGKQQLQIILGKEVDM